MNLSAICNKVVPALIAVALAGCVLEDYAQKKSLADVYVAENSKNASSVFREHEWIETWADIKNVKVYYSEPFLDNYEVFGTEWKAYKGDFGTWFGEHFGEVLREEIALLLKLEYDADSLRVDSMRIQVQMKADSFWVLSSRKMEQLRPHYISEVQVDDVPLSRERVEGESNGIEIYIMPLSVRTLNRDISMKALYRGRVSVVDSKRGDVILYAIIESDGSLFRDKHGRSALREFARKLIGRIWSTKDVSASHDAF
jgi:hypothetical protein